MKVIAGEALGVSAVIETRTPIVYQDWSLKAGASVTLPLEVRFDGCVYVFEGEAEIAGTRVADGQLAVLGAGDTLTLAATQGSKGARMLLLAGVPLREPVARYGPFVMNTEAEIHQAFRDYQSGRMGEIAR